MISLDQVMLLEQRVESAVEKIQQLQAENDALRSKCSELTNALSSKSEQLSSFETDQSQIESGILKALDRLNAIENQVLKATSQVSSAQQINIQSASVRSAAQDQNSIQTQSIPAQQAAQTSDFSQPAQAQDPQVQPTAQQTLGTPPSPVQEATENAQPLAHETESQATTEPFGLSSQFIQTSIQNDFYSMNEVPSQNQNAEEDFSGNNSEPEEENPDNLGFDIF